MSAVNFRSPKEMKSQSGFYVIFSLAVPRNEQAGPISPVNIQFDHDGIGVLVRSIYLADTRKLDSKYTPNIDSGRYAFWLSNGQRNDEKAQRVADTLIATITLLYQTDLSRVPSSDNGPVACWIPEHLLKWDRYVQHEDLIELDSSFQNRIGYSVMISQSIVDRAWSLLPIAMRDPFFDAIHFYQESIKDFCFLGDAMNAVLHGEMTQPVSRSEFARAENAILNSFKAVEAIIGDPPKDDKKFYRRLTDAGIDPNEMVGFRARGLSDGIEQLEPIGKKIRKMNDARDRRAAHGRTGSDRRFTYSEIMEYQALAEYVVNIAIEHQLKRGGRQKTV
jgi:hypothetical protein